MSRSSNSLKTSDVVVAPIKIKYSSSYDDTTYSSVGIRVLSGVNNEVTTEGSVAQPTLTYRSARHLFYSNYLTGSFPTSASAAFNWEQSTAAVGTLEADIRYFPTGSGDKIKILSIPREVFGEKISRGGFQLAAADGVTYNIVDDGNGNLIDIASDSLYVDEEYFSPGESFTEGYVYGGARNTHVGNILYAQGIIIITNQDYYDILDAGPFLQNRIFTFYTSDLAKVFDPLSGATADSTLLDINTFELEEIPGEAFPAYTVTDSTVTLSPAGPLFSVPGTYAIRYKVSSMSGVQSTATTTVNIIDSPAPVFIDYFIVLGNPGAIQVTGTKNSNTTQLLNISTTDLETEAVGTLQAPQVSANQLITVTLPPLTTYRQMTIADITDDTYTLLYATPTVISENILTYSWTTQPGRRYLILTVSTNTVETYLKYAEAVGLAELAAVP